MKLYLLITLTLFSCMPQRMLNQGNNEWQEGNIRYSNHCMVTAKIGFDSLGNIKAVYLRQGVRYNNPQQLLIYEDGRLTVNRELIGFNFPDTPSSVDTVNFERRYRENAVLIKQLIKE